MASTEAPRSVNFKGITSKGWDCMFTVRATDNEKLLADMGDLINRLEAIGTVPKGGLRDIHTGIPSPTPQAPAPSEPAPVQAEGLADAAYTFAAERLVGTTTGEKTYWKVQGGKFSQYGVTIWPEVLEAAGFAADQDPKVEYDLTGYTAYYTLNDKQKPNKVTHLAKE